MLQQEGRGTVVDFLPPRFHHDGGISFVHFEDVPPKAPSQLTGEASAAKRVLRLATVAVKRNAHDEGDGIPFFEKGRELLPAVLAFDGVQDDERTGRV